MTKTRELPRTILVILVAALLLFCATFASGCGDKSNNKSGANSGLITGDEVGNGDETEPGKGNESDPSVNSDLVIAMSDLTTKAAFFGITVDGTYMEVIAFKSGSEYRTAFNTCQVCYGSRNAYYVQSGRNLVCQNCGNQFALSEVGVKTAYVTCSPYPILADDRSDTDDSLIIPYSFLANAKSLFKTWKIV